MSDSDSYAEVSGSADAISVRGAREHNLKNIDVDLPRDRLVVVTGPSGSGKSSLLYDTLYAEGQRQFLESLGVSAGRVVSQLQRPEVDLIEGLQPTLAIDQRSGSANPRSTVGTVTEIHDHLRVMLARLGTPYCPNCKQPVRSQSVEEMLELLLAAPLGTKYMLLAPMKRGEKGKHLELFETIRKAGFLRARVDGAVVDIEPPPELNARKEHSIDAVIDRIILRDNVRDRLSESLRLAVRHGSGAVVVCSLSPDAELVKNADGADVSPWQDALYSTIHACPTCNMGFTEPEPRGFSFNSPYGACPECQGLGNRIEFDPALVFPDTTRALANNGCAAWKGLTAKQLAVHHAALASVLKKLSIGWDTPLADWSEQARHVLWRGDGKAFQGLAIELEQEYVTSLKPERREQLERYRGEVHCPACQGTRLRPEARAVLFAGKGIHDIAAFSIGEARRWFDELTVPATDAPIFDPLAREIRNRLGFLERVGLGYLGLDRSAATLSGGELQRVRLATSIGSGLIGVCYILDEPSIGLHPRDNDRLIASLRDLQEQGNTVLVVEHDEATMRAADLLIDMGLGAGVHGGRILASGSPSEVSANPNSITGDFLAGRRAIPIPQQRRKPHKSNQIVLEGCTANNLQNVDLTLPLGLFVCVTGVSGSGKSTLINGTLARALHRKLLGEGPLPGAYRALRGASAIKRLVRIDQSSIGRTPRSNPATYTGIYDEIRKLFTTTKESRQRGYKSGRFSFNVKGGRCEECQGLGSKRIEMNFLPDIEVPCPVCGGARFNAATLDIRYRGRTIADVLNMPIEEAVEFFANVPVIAPFVRCMNDVGLGYLALGQAGGTLSGGESQRIKLAAELGKFSNEPALYLLDEPTTGLHFEDIRKLLDVLQKLVVLGHSVLVIEHNLDVIKTADYVIDLGPEGGAGGGRIVAVGTPEEVARVEESRTGQHLDDLLRATS